MRLKAALLLAVLLFMPSALAAAELSVAPLLALLKDKQGWEAGDPVGETRSFLGFRAVTAKRRYSANGLVVDVEIVAGDITSLLFDKLDVKRAQPKPDERYETVNLDGDTATRMSTSTKAGLFIRLSDKAGLVVAGPPEASREIEEMARTFDRAAIAALVQRFD